MGRRCSIIPQWFARHIASDRRFASRTPIRDLHHRLVVAPPLVYGDQRLMVHDLMIVPHVAISWHDDDFGNRIATLERFAGNTRATAIRHRVTFPSTAMRNVPASFMQFHESVYDRAKRIGRAVATHMRCVPGSTSVLTTAAKAFAQASGVCQDYAHIMVAIATFYGSFSAGARPTLGLRSSHHQPIRRAPSFGRWILHTRGAPIAITSSSQRDAVSPTFRSSARLRHHVPSTVSRGATRVSVPF